MRLLAAGEELLLPEEERQAWITPSWRPGDAWVVETYYRNDASPDPRSTWRGPLRWRFRVEEERALDGLAVLEFSVEREREAAEEEALREARREAEEEAGDPRMAEAPEPPSRFVVARDTYRLLAARTWRREQGEFRPVEYVYHVPRSGRDGSDRRSGAASADHTLVPFELPDFTRPGVVMERGEGPDLELTLGGMPRIRAPERLTPLGPGYIKIEFDRPGDGTRVAQRWAQGDARWPVTSFTATTRSFRVEG
ncbi:MAG: hypothetical protein HY722_09855 [Planctomycetes bacterium]|nr:hypothetical protein [Planctomycetota bacterium]